MSETWADRDGNPLTHKDVALTTAASLQAFFKSQAGWKTPPSITITSEDEETELLTLDHPRTVIQIRYRPEGVYTTGIVAPGHPADKPLVYWPDNTQLEAALNTIFKLLRIGLTSVPTPGYPGYVPK